VTLVLVPVLYAIFVLDLKLVEWSTTPDDSGNAELPVVPGPVTAPSPTPA
jgi:hypothetical protein